MDNRLNKNFDMESFIEKRLLEIDNLNDRKEAREILTCVFRELYQYTESRFLNMEKEIIEEMKNQEEEYAIYIGVSSRQDFDITEGSMFPMMEDDLEEKVISTKYLADSLKVGTEVSIFTVFFQLEYEEIKKLLSGRRLFTGYIYTEKGEYPVTACVRLADRYQKAIRDLFKEIINNGISWKTVCMAYVNKFFDVYLVSADIPEDEYIEKVEINFQEYSQAVRYQFFPTWNIEKVSVISEVKKVACLDLVQYQHYINKKDLNNHFLIIADGHNMISRSKRDSGLIITTDIAEPKKWELYVVKEQGRQLSEYPLLGNKMEGKRVLLTRTKGDIYNVINSLGYRERLLLKDVIFPQKFKPLYTTYDMNYGITHEFQHNKELPSMVLQFIKKKQDFLQTDILSYMVSVVQRYYPEYICCGEFVMDE